MQTFPDLFANLSSFTRGVRFEYSLVPWAIQEAELLGSDLAWSRSWQTVALAEGVARSAASDVGIDLVCMRANGRCIAVQCKFVSPGKTLSWLGISTFIATALTFPFLDELVIVTTGRPSRRTQELLRWSPKPVRIITLTDEDLRRFHQQPGWRYVLTDIRRPDDAGDIPSTSSNLVPESRARMCKGSTGARLQQLRDFIDNHGRLPCRRRSASDSERALANYYAVVSSDFRLGRCTPQTIQHFLDLRIPLYQKPLPLETTAALIRSAFDRTSTRSIRRLSADRSNDTTLKERPIVPASVSADRIIQLSEMAVRVQESLQEQFMRANHQVVKTQARRKRSSEPEADPSRRIRQSHASIRASQAATVGQPIR